MVLSTLGNEEKLEWGRQAVTGKVTIHQFSGIDVWS